MQQACRAWCCQWSRRPAEAEVPAHGSMATWLMTPAATPGPGPGPGPGQSTMGSPGRQEEGGGCSETGENLSAVNFDISQNLR